MVKQPNHLASYVEKVSAGHIVPTQLAQGVALRQTQALALAPTLRGFLGEEAGDLVQGVDLTQGVLTLCAPAQVCGKLYYRIPKLIKAVHEIKGFEDVHQISLVIQHIPSKI